MNILLISELYPLSSEDSTPKILHQFAKEWQKMGHRVFVVRSNFLFTCPLLGKKIHSEGFYDLEGVPVLNLNFLFTADTALNFSERFDLKGFEPDVIVSHMPCGIVTTNRFNMKRNLPTVIGIHQTNIRLLKEWIFKFYFSPSLKRAYDSADLIAYRSFWLKNAFEKEYKITNQKTCFAFSGVDSEYIQSLDFMKNKLEWKNKKSVKFATVASLIKRKNVDKIIKALENLDYDWSLEVIGDGKQRLALEKLVIKLGLQEKVKFKGNLYHKEVIERLKEADIFILPSVDETFGLVYLEAMASGCLTVGVENDGISGILKENADGQNGFLLKKPNPQTIKEKIDKILSMDEFELIKIVEKMHEDIQLYTKENMARAYLDEIEKII